MASIPAPKGISLAMYEASVSIAREALHCKTNEELKSMCESIIQMIEQITPKEE